MGKKPPKWLPGERVNETILTQRKSVAQLRADRVVRKDKLKDQRSRMKAKLDAKRKKKLATKKFTPAQAILDKAIRKEKQARGYWKRGEKFNTRLYKRPAEKTAAQYEHAPIALAVRTGGQQLAREVSSGLQKLGLRKMYAARLIHLNPANDRLCKLLKTVIVVGFPTVEQLEALVRTRAAFWNPEKKSKTFINGNLQIEHTLGHLNILTVEELVDVVVKKGEHLDEVLRHLAAFDFHPPRHLYIERHRSAHDKLELANPEAFQSYLKLQLDATARERRAAKKNGKANPKRAAVAAAKKKLPRKKAPGSVPIVSKPDDLVAAATASSKVPQGRRGRKKAAASA